MQCDKGCYQHRADHHDPEDSRVDQVGEDAREETEHAFVCVGGAGPGRKALQVGHPGGERVVGGSRNRCFNLLGSWFLLFSLVEWRMTEDGQRFRWADELCFGEEKHGRQETSYVERQLRNEEILVAFILRQHAADDGDCRRHAGQGADNHLFEEVSLSFLGHAYNLKVTR